MVRLGHEIGDDLGLAVDLDDPALDPEALVVLRPAAEARARGRVLVLQRLALAHANASSMSIFCSSRWLAFEPVAGLALGARDTQLSGSRAPRTVGRFE